MRHAIFVSLGNEKSTVIEMLSESSKSDHSDLLIVGTKHLPDFVE